VLAYHLAPAEGNNDSKDAEAEEMVPVAIPTARDALKATQVILQHLLHQPDVEMKDARELQRLERALQERLLPRQQSTLDSWIM
jgi:hypothetical protein